MINRFPVIIAADRGVRKSVPWAVVGCALLSIIISFTFFFEPHLQEFRILFGVISAVSILLVYCVIQFVRGEPSTKSVAYTREIQIFEDKIKLAKYLTMGADPAVSDEPEFIVIPVADLLGVTLLRKSFLRSFVKSGFYRFKTRSRTIFLSQIYLGKNEETFAASLGDLGIQVESVVEPWETFGS